jgi:virginiamycin B lyase
VAPHTSITVEPSTGPAPGKRAPRTASVATPTIRGITTEAGSAHQVIPTFSTGWVEYTIPTAGANAEDMRLSYDGHLFFEEDGGFLGELDPAADKFTEWAVPFPNSGYYNIALAGNALWFAEAGTFAPVPTKVGVLLW